MKQNPEQCEKGQHVRGDNDGYQFTKGGKDKVYRCKKCNRRINERTGDVVVAG